MKNDIIQFFHKNSNDIEFLLDDCKILLSNGKGNDKRTYILTNILSGIVKDNLFGDNHNEFYSVLKDKINSETLNYLASVMKEERENLINYYKEIENIQKEKLPKRVDIEWKFVGLASLNKIDVNDLEPKIIVNLIFNDGSSKVLETDFAGFKKLQEEIDLSLSSFNSAYAKRINTFSK
jgi:hypothetical protein